jgi:hypothetical protein
MRFVPENPLEEALVLAQRDPLARPAFYRLLVESPLHVLGRADGEHGNELTIPTLRHNGREYLPVFSARTRLIAFGGERAHFVKRAREVFEAAVGANFVLNPGSDCGKRLMAVEIAFWLDPSARTRRRLEAARVRLTAPKTEPKQLLQALDYFFRRRGDVISAHFLEATALDGKEPPHPVIGIRSENWTKIAAEVSELAAAVDPETIVDLVEIGSAADAGAAALANTPPFYQRLPN